MRGSGCLERPVGGLRSGPLSQLPGGRIWVLRSGGQLGVGEQWPAEMERARPNSQSCGGRGGAAGPPAGGGASWARSWRQERQSRHLVGRRAHPLGGFLECAQRGEWAVGNVTLLGPKPVEAARPDGLPRRGHGAHEAGQEKPGSPFLHPSPPGEERLCLNRPPSWCPIGLRA